MSRLNITRSVCRLGRHATIVLIVLLYGQWAWSAPMSATPAFDLVDRIGVQTHLGWTGSPYVKRFAEVKTALAELGVHYVRDRIGSTASQARLRELWRAGGIRVLAVVDTRTEWSYNQKLNPDGIGGLLAQAKSNIGTDAIIGLEGPNELNQAEVHFGYMNWPQDLRAFMTRLSREANADGALRNTPVVVPGLAAPARQYWYDRLGDLSAMSDKGNGHIYGTYWGISQKLDQLLPILDQQRPNSRLWVSEFGWHTATNSHMAPIDENTKVKYLARAILEPQVRPQVEKAFIYQLLDPENDPGKRSNRAHFGLLDYHLNRKPSFYAVGNMMNLLCDTPLAVPARSLDYTLDGDLGDIRSLLLQKNNGAFYLVLWLEKQSFRALSGPVSNAPQVVNVAFGQAVERVQVYRPADPETDLSQGQNPVKSVAWPSRLTLDVPDHPLILEIVPADATSSRLPGCRQT